MEARVQEFDPAITHIEPDKNVGTLSTQEFTAGQNISSKFISVDPSRVEAFVRTSWEVPGCNIKIWPNDTEEDYMRFTLFEETHINRDAQNMPDLTLRGMLRNVAAARFTSGLVPIELGVDEDMYPQGDLEVFWQKLSQIEKKL
jgi:hypothetical protein